VSAAAGSLRGELRAQLSLAAPVVLIHLGMIAMSVVDIAVVGHHSSTELAGVAIGNSLAFALLSFGLGSLLVLDPLVSQAVGALDREAIALALRRGLVLAVLLTVPVSIALLFTSPVAHLLGVQPGLMPAAEGYVRAILPGVLPFYGFVALRQVLQSMRRLRPLLLVMLFANLLNLFLDLALVQGRFGLPAMGARGCGIATTIGRWFQFVGVLVLAWPVLAPYLRGRVPGVLRPGPLLRMLLLGLPIGAHLVTEIGGFSLVALWMGRLGEVPASSHQVAINIASITFMIPLGVSIAASVRVGRAVGAGEQAGVRRATRVATVLGVLVMVVSATILALFPGPLAALYSSDPAVCVLAAELIVLVAVFQVFDGLQVVSAGILRGTGNTRFPFLAFLCGFWALGMPLGYWLCFHAEMGPAGLYWGFTAGLGVVALMLVLRVRQATAGTVERLHLG